MAKRIRVKTLKIAARLVEIRANKIRESGILIKSANRLLRRRERLSDGGGICLSVEID